MADSYFLKLPWKSSDDRLTRLMRWAGFLVHLLKFLSPEKACFYA